MKRIVSIQDISDIGKCSLTAALPVISAMGVECAVLPTAVLSAHSQFEGFTFRGTGSTAQSECSVRFSFLYTGDFNQAVLRAVYLDGAADVPALAIKKAASNAVTWDSADDGTVSVTAVELRSVRGLPFYAFTCSDGSVAYALACDESALDSVSGALEIYEETMRDGLREYVEISGAE